MSQPVTFRVSTGLMTADHRLRMGIAIWEFEWCVDRQTNQAGDVLGGKWITAADIVATIGTSERSVLRNLGRLAKEGYIDLTKTRRGFRLRVRNQKKYRASPADVPVRIEGSHRQKRRSSPADVPTSPADLSGSPADVAVSNDVVTPERTRKQTRSGSAHLTTHAPGRLLQAFGERHERHLGAKYHAAFARDLKLLKDLAATYGESMLVEVFDAFFDARRWAAKWSKAHSAGGRPPEDGRWWASRCVATIVGVHKALPHLLGAYEFEAGKEGDSGGEG